MDGWMQNQYLSYVNQQLWIILCLFVVSALTVKMCVCIEGRGKLEYAINFFTARLEL